MYLQKVDKKSLSVFDEKRKYINAIENLLGINESIIDVIS